MSFGRRLLVAYIYLFTIVSALLLAFLFALAFYLGTGGESPHGTQIRSMDTPAEG